jgi:hypothetical protein
MIQLAGFTLTEDEWRGFDAEERALLMDAGTPAFADDSYDEYTLVFVHDVRPSLPGHVRRRRRNHRKHARKGR